MKKPEVKNLVDCSFKNPTLEKSGKSLPMFWCRMLNSMDDEFYFYVQ